jgi:hypothetical protein
MDYVLSFRKPEISFSTLFLKMSLRRDFSLTLEVTD